MLPLEKIRVQAELQDRLNCIVHPTWRSAGFSWHRAIMVEAAEALEHYGWKWWKKQEPDLVQTKLELVDIWHFILSQYLQDYGSVNDASQRLFSHLQSMSLQYFRTQPIPTNLEMLAVNATTHTLSLPTRFTALAEQLNLSGDELHEMYIAKNVLNLFRQDHGYQEGTYRKVWNGKEDNEVLAWVMSSRPGLSPDELLVQLDHLYTTSKEAK
jgi:dimeric dUTPase (all-alpha-NTP-PPase superfamily)